MLTLWQHPEEDKSPASFNGLCSGSLFYRVHSLMPSSAILNGDRLIERLGSLGVVQSETYATNVRDPCQLLTVIERRERLTTWCDLHLNPDFFACHAYALARAQ